MKFSWKFLRFTLKNLNGKLIFWPFSHFFKGSGGCWRIFCLLLIPFCGWGGDFSDWCGIQAGWRGRVPPPFHPTLCNFGRKAKLMNLWKKFEMFWHIFRVGGKPPGGTAGVRGADVCINEHGCTNASKEEVWAWRHGRHTWTRSDRPGRKVFGRTPAKA